MNHFAITQMMSACNLIFSDYNRNNLDKEMP